MNTIPQRRQLEVTAEQGSTRFDLEKPFRRYKGFQKIK